MAVNRSKIAILVLSCRYGYDDFKAGQYNWVKDAHDLGVETFFVEGFGSEVDPNSFLDIGLDVFDEVFFKILRVGCSDSFEGTFLKTLVALRFLFESGFDVVFRTNLSSYIDVRSLLDYVSENNVDKSCYAGINGSSTLFREVNFFRFNRLFNRIVQNFNFGQNPISFASGAGFFIGSERFSPFLGSPEMRNVIDDFGIGYYSDPNSQKTIDSVPRFWYGRGFDYSSPLVYSDFIRLNGFHYRFKSSDRSLDAAMLSAFHDPNFRYSVLKHYA